jgi:hypothetical protein
VINNTLIDVLSILKRLPETKLPTMNFDILLGKIAVDNSILLDIKEILHELKNDSNALITPFIKNCFVIQLPEFSIIHHNMEENSIINIIFLKLYQTHFFEINFKLIISSFVTSFSNLADNEFLVKNFNRIMELLSDKEDSFIFHSFKIIIGKFELLKTSENLATWEE